MKYSFVDLREYSQSKFVKTDFEGLEQFFKNVAIGSEYMVCLRWHYYEKPRVYIYIFIQLT